MSELICHTYDDIRLSKKRVLILKSNQYQIWSTIWTHRLQKLHVDNLEKNDILALYWTDSEEELQRSHISSQYTVIKSDTENDLESMSIVAIDKASGCQFMTKQISLNKTAVSLIDKSLIPPDFSTYSKLMIPVF
jgi:hypothetical protein